MALSTHFQNRYSAKFVRAITNPDVVNASSVDTTRLNNAASDAEEWFREIVGVAYSDSDNGHVAAACYALEVILRERAEKYGEGLDKMRERAEQKMIALSRRTARNRI